MNLNLYGYKGKWIMLDCGISFTHEVGLEVIMPDISFIQEHRKDLLGIILTHAHEDHIGALPYLWDRLRVPLYATSFTAHLIREKLKESGHLKEATLHEVTPNTLIDLSPFQAEFIALTHSIPEPMAVAIHTPKGCIVHTGDWKIDPSPLIGETTDIDYLKKLGDKGVLALVCDSTNAFVKGRSGSEANVRKELIRLIKRKKGRVIVACFASNVARLSSAAIAAQETGRRVILFGRSLYRMEEAARKAGYLKDLEPFLHENDLKKYQPEEILIICTGSQGEPRSALTRMAHGTHPRIHLDENDTVIFSSRIIPGNEPYIKDLHERLHARGAEVIQDHEEDIHVSGHPARDELKDMYTWIRPQILVPVHGEGRHMREQALWAQKCGVPHTIVPTNGSIVALDPHHLGVVDKVPHGRWTVDGTTVVPRQEIHLKERAKLMDSGVVSVALMFKGKAQALEKVEINMMGVAEPSLQRILKEKMEKALYQEHVELASSEKSMHETIRLIIRRIAMAVKGRKPQVLIHTLKAS